MKKLLIAFLAFVILGGLARGVRAQGLDQYGGSLDLQCPNGATGHFYAQEIGNRWWLCDALGNAFWETGVFDVFRPPVTNSKYGGVYPWAAHKDAQLKLWGFNTLDVDIDAPLLPMATWSGWSGDHTQPNKMEFTLFIDASDYPANANVPACQQAGIGTTKEFGFLDDPAEWQYGSGFKITVNDPFSPCYATWLDQEFNAATSYSTNGVTTANMNSPWLIGIEPGEGDTITGFGPGPVSQDGPSGGLNTSPALATVPVGYNNDNLSLALVMASPWGAYSGYWGYLETIDRTVQAKTEFANWLQGNGQVSLDVPASASSSSGTVTLTFSNTQPLPYAAGDTVNVTACSDANFNGSGLTVASVSGYSITYAEPVSDTASGVNYCVVSLTKTVITGAALASGSETVTMAVNPYKAGDIVTIMGVTPSAFNTVSGTGCGVTAYTATTFTCTNGSGSATYTSGGVATSGPGYTLAGLNAAWGSNYTTWGSNGANYVDTISTVASLGGCNRTTWACVGTLSHVPDMYSVWVRDNGAVVAGAGSAGAQSGIYAQGGKFLSNNYYAITKLVDNAGAVTVTCSTPVGFVPGQQFVMYTSASDGPSGNPGPFNGSVLTVTAVSGNTFSFTAGSATFSIPNASSNDYATDASQINFTTGAYSFKLPANLTFTSTVAASSGGSVTQTVPSTAQPFAVGESISISGCRNTAYQGNINGGAYATTVTAVSSSAPYTVTYADNQASGSSMGCYITAATGANNDVITIDYYSGGWGHGTGFLDENGAHSWIPTDEKSLTGSGTTDAFRNDMNDFIYHFAAAWFGTSRRIFKNYWPNVMFMGADESSGAWCAPARAPVLRAVGQYVDFATFGSFVCDDSNDQSKFDYTMKYVGNIPIMQWTGVVASADNSVQPDTPTMPPNEITANQAARGAEYEKVINQFLNFKVDPGNGPASGQYPFVGIHFWSGGADDPSQGNWGLTTYPNDNAYDGKGAVTAVGTDQWGYPTGGETANYGDSLTAIGRANRLWLDLIPRALVKTTGAP